MAVVPTTWNPADKAASVTLSGGNLTASSAGGSVRSVFSATSGKYYCEFTFASASTQMIGAATSSASLASYPGSDANGYAYEYSTGSVASGGTNIASGTSAPTVLGVLLDAGARKLKFTIDNVDYGTEISIAGSDPIFLIFGYGGTSTANFGGSSFTYSVPSGYESGFGADAARTVNPGSVVAGSIGVPTALLQQPVTLLPASVVAGSVGDPTGQIGYPATLQPSSVVVGSVGTPTALPYRNRTVKPYSLTPVSIGAPALVYSPVGPSDRTLNPASVRAGSIGSPAAMAVARLQPFSVSVGSVGAPGVVVGLSPASTVAGSVGTPSVRVGLHPGSATACVVGSPSLGNVVRPASVVVGSVGTPSFFGASTIKPSSVIAGTVGSPRVSGVTIRPTSVICSGVVGRPSISMGATC